MHAVLVDTVLCNLRTFIEAVSLESISLSTCILQQVITLGKGRVSLQSYQLHPGAACVPALLLALLDMLPRSPESTMRI